MEALEASTTPTVYDLWLHGLSKHTRRAYSADAKLFREFVGGKPLREATLADVQLFARHLETLPLQDGSRRRILAGVKSLFAFAARNGHVDRDVAAPLRLPKCKDTLAERILDKAEVEALIAAADVVGRHRDRAIVELLYYAGLRVSELAALRWRDLRARGKAGQATIFGKGGKTRAVTIPPAVWESLMQLGGSRNPNMPVFLSRRGGHLDVSQVLRIVKAAASRAGITRGVSPHWLRHCHASHALDAQAPIHLVQQTLGHASVATTSRYLHARPQDSSSNYLPGGGDDRRGTDQARAD